MLSPGLASSAERGPLCSHVDPLSPSDSRCCQLASTWLLKHSPLTIEENGILQRCTHGLQNTVSTLAAANDTFTLRRQISTRNPEKMRRLLHGGRVPMKMGVRPGVIPVEQFTSQVFP